jgi:hypothetical protein
MPDVYNEDIWLFLEKSANEIDNDQLDILGPGLSIFMCVFFLNIFYHHPIVFDARLNLWSHNFFHFIVISFILVSMNFLVVIAGMVIGWQLGTAIERLLIIHHPLVSMMNYAEKNNKKKKIIKIFKSHLVDNNIIWIDLNNDKKVVHCKEFFKKKLKLK